MVLQRWRTGQGGKHASRMHTLWYNVSRSSTYSPDGSSGSAQQVQLSHGGEQRLVESTRIDVYSPQVNKLEHRIPAQVQLVRWLQIVQSGDQARPTGASIPQVWQADAVLCVGAVPSHAVLHPLVPT